MLSDVDRALFSVYPPSFGSSANLEAVAVEMTKTAAVQDNEGSSGRGQGLIK